MTKFSLSQCVTLACMLEVTAPKVGNVHRGADFDDVSLNDFLVSAVAIGPILAETHHIGVGQAILQAVRATRELVGSNTNLGMILLLAPLAAVGPDEELESGVGPVLAKMTPDDAAAVLRVKVVVPNTQSRWRLMLLSSCEASRLVARVRCPV